jgi:hypothetical protein
MFAVFSSYLFVDSLDVNNEPDEERIVEYGSHWSNWIVKPYDFFSHPDDYWFIDNRCPNPEEINSCLQNIPLHVSQ